MKNRPVLSGLAALTIVITFGACNNPTPEKQNETKSVAKEFTDLRKAVMKDINTRIDALEVETRTLASELKMRANKTGQAIDKQAEEEAQQLQQEVRELRNKAQQLANKSAEEVDETRQELEDALDAAKAKAKDLRERVDKAGEVLTEDQKS